MTEPRLDALDLQPARDADPLSLPLPLPGATPWPLLQRSGLRALEAAALPRRPTDGLMRAAGRSAARLALAVAPHATGFRVLCGTGHNGGDGLWAAVELRRAGHAVSAWRAPGGRPAEANERAWQAAQAAGVRLEDGPVPRPADADDRRLTIDALLGIGCIRAVGDGPLQAGIDAALQAADGRHGVLALDLPSGLDTDTGQPHGRAVRARHTLTFLAGKPGLFTGRGRDHAGRVWLDTLGVGLDEADDPYPGGPARRLWLLPRLSAWALGEPAVQASHKGSFGDVIVLGGAAGMRGAAALAASAAHAAGAGRVWWMAPDGQGDSSSALADGPGTAALRPELMQLDARGWDGGRGAAGRTVVAGCGGGGHEAPDDALVRSVHQALEHADRLVLDADALNAVARHTTLQAAVRARGGPGGRGLATVLTPHPLEAARLLGVQAADVQTDRLQAAAALADGFHALVLLKGSGTCVAVPGGEAWIVAAGSPALATAGSGDVLAGWIGGTWSRRVGGGEGSGDIALAATLASASLHATVAESVGHGPLRALDLIEAMHAGQAGLGARAGIFQR